MGALLSKIGLLKDVLSGMAGFGNNNQNGGSQDTNASACPKHWWDFVIDAVNRLIRPFLLFGVIAIFSWAVYAPAAFTLFAKAIATLPDNAWIAILAILLAWMTPRAVRDVRGGVAVSTTTTVVTDPGKAPEPAPAGTSGIPDDHPVLDKAPAPNPSIQAWKDAAKAASKA